MWYTTVETTAHGVQTYRTVDIFPNRCALERVFAYQVHDAVMIIIIAQMM